MGMIYKDPQTGQTTVAANEKMAKILADGGYEEVKDAAERKAARGGFAPNPVPAVPSQPAIVMEEKDGEGKGKAAKEKSTGTEQE